MNFLISGLPLAPFVPLFSMTDLELASRRAVRRVVDATPGFPCRVSLEDAPVGETVLLLNHEHLAVEGPYRSSHAIYVRQNAREARLEPGQVPPMLERRLLSLRGFTADGFLKCAEVLPGAGLRDAIAPMFEDSAVSFLHVHNAKPGCYAARVDRRPG
jgi:hypothetical protein